MSFFKKADVARLYLATDNTAPIIWLAYVLCQDESANADLDLGTAYSGLKGNFVFSAIPVPLPDAVAQQEFVKKIDNLSITPRGMVWLMDPKNITLDTVRIVSLSEDGASTVSQLTVPFIDGQLTFNAASGIKLKLLAETTTLELCLSEGKLYFMGNAAPKDLDYRREATFYFAGPLRGRFVFGFNLPFAALYDNLKLGFQFSIPFNTYDGSRAVVPGWLPLLDRQQGSNPRARFSMVLDPADPCNQYSSNSTSMLFLGTNDDGSPTLLPSFYRSIYGERIWLAPQPDPGGTEGARLLVYPGGIDAETGASLFHTSLAGDFALQMEAPVVDKDYTLMCGLQGTEYIGFHPHIQGDPGQTGDRLRFSADRGGYAPLYPFPVASPVGPPVDINASLLDITWRTSWANVVRAPGQAGAIPYVSQPKGAALYGRDDLIYPSDNQLFGIKNPSIVLGGDGAFPLAPYAGAQPGDGKIGFSREQMEDFERQVIAATRSKAIGSIQAGVTGSVTCCLTSRIENLSDKPYNTTTPTGLLVTVEGDGRWSKILLGQKSDQVQMYFCQPDTALQQAFQTSQLFLVVANAKHLGKLTGSCDGSNGEQAAFFNQMHLDGWLFSAAVGQNHGYGDYASVMIVKGRKGVLFDPTDDQTRNGSLVSNPAKWTQRGDFAAPTTVDNPNPDPNQQVILSQWLQDYFADASRQPDTEYFARFNAIARDENWTGILILKMKITELPKDLLGITSGITQPEAFNVHHFGIEIGQIQNDPTAAQIDLKDSSSMFGLIHYVDPNYNPVQPTQPVPPTTGAVYDFRLLTLKVLFANTAIKRFNSYAQVTLNQWFGATVDHMGEGGNAYNSIVLRGSYQNNGKQPVYSLGSLADNCFYFGGNLVNKVEITSAQLSTREANAQGKTVSWLGLTGFIDFNIVQGNGGDFDIYSFGSDAGNDQPRKGLSFANLGLEISCPADNPADKTFTFKTGEVHFDPSTSTPRKDSLYENLALSLEGFVAGSAEETPSKKGYLTVITDAKLTGVDGGVWHGLRYRLNLGSPGELAGKANLNSHLLLAWSPDSASAGSYKGLLGIALPGTGGGANLISLQNVLKLSIGQIRLTLDRTQNSFLLMFTEIALKFLGLLKIPPGGSSLFYLFGNPKSEGKASGLGWYARYANKPKSTD